MGRRHKKERITDFLDDPAWDQKEQSGPSGDDGEWHYVEDAFHDVPEDAPDEEEIAKLVKQLKNTY